MSYVSDKRRRLTRRVSFRITDNQSRSLDRMIQNGMNPSLQFRRVFDRMMKDAKKRRFF